MDKFYFSQIQIFNDGTEAKALFDYNTFNDALLAYHSFMFSSMSNENIKSVIAVIIDSDTIPRIRDKWERNPINDEVAE